MSASVRQRLVFFDLETGGLRPWENPITQIAALAVDAETLEEVEAFELKIQFPTSRCDPQALETNSYDPKVWAREAVPIAEAEKRISSFLRSHATLCLVSKKGRPYRVSQLVGHNAAGFDLPFLRAWYERRGAFLPAGFWPVDTIQMAAIVQHLGIVEYESLALGELLRHYGYPLDDAHDALADVRGTLVLYRELIRELQKPHRIPRWAQAELALPAEEK